MMVIPCHYNQSDELYYNATTTLQCARIVHTLCLPLPHFSKLVSHYTKVHVALEIYAIIFLSLTVTTTSLL